MDTTTSPTPAGPSTFRPPREALDPRVRRWWRWHLLLWGCGPGVLLLLLGAVLAAPLGAGAWWIAGPGLVIAVPATIAVLVLPGYWYRVHRWEISHEAVYTRSGYLWVEWRAAPLSRVQTVDTRRGPLQQMCGLASLVVTTASTRGEVAVHGLDADRAVEYARSLTLRTQAVPGDAT